VGVGQHAAKQVRQILDHPLGLLWIRADQTGDHVHAVEQEMGANARLQRLDAGLQLGALLNAQLLLQVKVAQQNARWDRGHHHGIERRPELRLVSATPRQCQLPGHRHPGGDGQQRQVTDCRSPGVAHTHQPAVALTERHPQRHESDAGKAGPVEIDNPEPRHGHQQRQQQGKHHDAQETFAAA